MDDKTTNFDPYGTREFEDANVQDASPETQTHSDSGTGHGSSGLEVRCPNCHVPIKVAVDTALTDLTCSACGSHFSLVDDSEASRLASPLGTLGRFELISRLGMGAFGAVWKARDKELDRTVAIKIPRQSALSGADQEQFFREARAAAQLRHPNIVSVHEVGRDGENVYIVSDFVRGVTLSDWLTGQQLTNREAADLCAKIADTLHYAHEQGVIHRDLKTANIMIDGSGEPHLMDFGLARREVGEVTVTMDGQILGTPAYMSPEQAQGEGHSADRRSDVYSLGVVLFQLLTGELPFRGNARMLMHQVINDDPPSPRKLNANIARDLETVTLKCLEKDPAQRYETAAAVAAELRRYMSGQAIQARPVSRMEHAWRWCKRKPATAILVVTMSGTLIVLVAALAERNAANEARAAERVARSAEKKATQAEKNALSARDEETNAKEEAISAANRESKAKSEAMAAQNAEMRARNDALAARKKAEVAERKSQEEVFSARNAANAAVKRAEIEREHFWLQPYCAMSLGWCLFVQGKPDEARDAFRAELKELYREDGSYNLENADPGQMTAAYLLNLTDEPIYIDHFKGNKGLACFPWFYVAQRREIENRKDAAIAAYQRCVELGVGDNPHTVRALAQWRLEKLKQASQPNQK